MLHTTAVSLVITGTCTIMLHTTAIDLVQPGTSFAMLTDTYRNLLCTALYNCYHVLYIQVIASLCCIPLLPIMYKHVFASSCCIAFLLSMYRNLPASHSAAYHCYQSFSYRNLLCHTASKCNHFLSCRYLLHHAVNFVIEVLASSCCIR